MKINFNIHYNTSAKEVIKVLYRAAATPGECNLKQMPGGLWTGAIDIDAPGQLHYKYFVFSQNRAVRGEWGLKLREFELGKNRDAVVTLQDSWHDIPADSYLDSSAAEFCLNPRARAQASAAPYPAKALVLRARCAGIKEGQKMLLCANQPTLGNWDAAKGYPLKETAHNEWTAIIDASKINFPLEYKFVVYDPARETYVWQEGQNYELKDLPAGHCDMLVVSDLQPQFGLPAQKASGIVLPVFSLRSEGSFGVGDFGDIKKLIDWAAHTGQKVLQFLPINDTNITRTWTDSYPYNSISVYALHPIYADLRQLPIERDAEFSALQWELNVLPEVDYEKVNNAKFKYLREAFRNEGAEVFATEDYKTFFKHNRRWLINYSAFCYLRDTYGTADFNAWPKYSRFNPRDIDALCIPGKKTLIEIAFYCYVQYKLHCQLSDAAIYARAKAVALKGDIPIGISPFSVEAWAEPSLFNMDSQAGAPPDDFSVNGQNWGFPTYNWDAMSRNGYKWWTQRMQHMAQYFDAYRIDHVLGFFRIWDIASHSVHGLLGQFSPALPMSRAEVASFGLQFKDSYLRPYITREILLQIFGDRAVEVEKTYLNAVSEDNFEMKPEFDTQRKVEAAFAGKSSARNIALREGLYSLISNVLFVSDKKRTDLYHPRISAPQDYAFKALGAAEQSAFLKLYNHYFYERHNDFWYDSAMAKLPAIIQSTRMLVCAEDLGMIPACVEHVMARLQMLSLEIQRMPKKTGAKFADTREYPALSVCTPSTHDMSTLRGWWTEDADTTQIFYNNVLGLPGPAPKDATPEICENIVTAHLQSPAILSIISFQDWMAIDGKLRRKDAAAERINLPVIVRYYWRYRMHLTLEQLMRETDFNSKVCRLTELSQR